MAVFLSRMYYIRVICIYKLKWLELDLVWHCLKNPRYHLWYHRESEIKLNITDQSDIGGNSFGFWSVNSQVFWVANPVRLDKCSEPSKENGRFGSDFSMRFISYSVVTSHSNTLIFPNAIFCWRFKTRFIHCRRARFPQNLFWESTYSM